MSSAVNPQMTFFFYMFLRFSGKWDVIFLDGWCVSIKISYEYYNIINASDFARFQTFLCAILSSSIAYVILFSNGLSGKFSVKCNMSHNYETMNIFKIQMKKKNEKFSEIVFVNI